MHISTSYQRYSEGFGTHLLPGMYSTPVHAVPKPRSVKLRLVNDHSAGPFSLNSMIAREDVIGAKMDSISDLIGALLRYRRDHPDKTLILFKSDVSAAYRRLPLLHSGKSSRSSLLTISDMSTAALVSEEGVRVDTTLHLWDLYCGSRSSSNFSQIYLVISTTISPSTKKEMSCGTILINAIIPPSKPNSFNCGTKSGYPTTSRNKNMCPYCAS